MFLPFLGKVRMGNNQYPPQPSLIREGARLFVIADSGADPQSQDSEMLKHVGRSDVQDDTNPLPQFLPQGREVKRFSSRFTLHSSPKKRVAFTLAEGATHVANSNNIRRAAFTLAEVLITLGIIGIVAVMTLSTVISKIQDKQNIAKWKKEYSVINNAFNEVVADGVTICNHTQYGHCNGQSYTDEFLEAIQAKLRIIDYCGVSSSVVSEDKVCDYYNSDWYEKYAKYRWSGVANIYSRYKAFGGRTESNPGYSAYGVNAYNFYKLALLLTDGAVIYFGELWSGPWIVVDVNNFQKGPNEFGRDVFVIRVSSDIIKNKHYIAPAGSEKIYEDNASLNNPSYGITGCSKDIGKQKSNTVYEVAGSGCSAKYLLE